MGQCRRLADEDRQEVQYDVGKTAGTQQASEPGSDFPGSENIPAGMIPAIPGSQCRGQT